jgi:hypothetical protein
MVIYVALAALAAFFLFFGLRYLATEKTRPKTGGMTFETSSSKLDIYVVEAENWWQHLRAMPLFWVSFFCTSILIALDYRFGFDRAGIWGCIILGSLFAAAEVAIPMIAMKGDVKGKRDAMSWVLLVLFTLFSTVAVIGSTAEISTTTGARNDVGVTSHADDMKRLSQLQAERDGIQMNRGFDALDKLAKTTEEAADREKDRKFCGPKCEDLKKQAAELRAQADDAKRKERLIGEIEALKTKMSGGGSELRMDSDPLASAISGMSGDAISRDQVRKYGLTLLGLLLVGGLTMLWVRVGDDLKEEIAWETAHRGEIADTARSTLGLPPKYSASADPVQLLPPPRASAATDGITINVTKIEDMRRSFANDADLLEVDSLLDRLMMRADGGRVTFAALYKAFQADHNAQYMTMPIMADKLFIISRYRDDVRITADGELTGWLLKPMEQRGV